MAKSKTATARTGLELSACEIGAQEKLRGMLSLQRYGILRQIDEERLRQRISTVDMPGAYVNHMHSGDPRLCTLIRMLDKLGLELQLTRKGGGTL